VERPATAGFHRTKEYRMKEKIKETIDIFIKSMCLELEATVTEVDGGLTVDLSGEDRDLLLERNGELLSALQLILPKVLRTELDQGSTSLLIESQGFRETRDEELKEIALHAAQKVGTSGELMLLSPMNPYERRIIHLALKDDERVVTKSEGDGFLRSVGVHPSRDFSR
jgi:spoIIIJ-associated protein